MKLEARSFRPLADRVSGRLPVGVLQRLSGAPGRAGRLAAAGLHQRWATIATGPAAGLAFNCGAGNPDYSIGTYEPNIQQVFVDHIRPGMAVLDIGANVGFFTVLSARLTGPGGYVAAFEPDPVNAAFVRDNAARNDFAHVDIFTAAVSATPGREAFWLADYAGGHALASAGRPPDARERIEVEVLSIDVLRHQGRLPAVGFVKIDVEGAEVDVLRGMEATLHSDRPTLLVEADAADQAELTDRRGGIEAFLGRVGYRCTRLEGAYHDIAWQVTHLLAVPA